MVKGKDKKKLIPKKIISHETISIAGTQCFEKVTDYSSRR